MEPLIRKHETRGDPAEAAPGAHGSAFLCGSVWRSWILLAAMSMMTVAGLVTAIPPLLTGRVVNPWPWMKTDLVLLAGLSLTVIALVGCLARQQRRVIRVHGDMQLLKEDSDRRLRRNANRLDALTRISHIISVETDLQHVFDAITSTCVETFGCHRASLMLFESESGELVVRSVSGQKDVDILNARQRLGQGIAGYAAEHREAMLLSSPHDYGRHPGLQYRDPSLTSAMVVPIIVRDDLVGVLNVSSRSPDVVYVSEDLLALQGFASGAGACIRHTEHVTWMRKMVPHLSGAPSDEPRRQSR